MKITKLSLTNFRSFKETQDIEFAPITLLFGPNSVGKSSVLMSLFYLQQILSKGQCDPKELDALGGKRIGGFESLVNGRNTSNRITIKVDIDKSGEIGATFAKLPDLIDNNFGLTVESPCGIADSFSVEIELAWSEKKETAYVSQCKIWLDDILAVKLESDAGLKQARISFINFNHPLLSSDTEYETLEDGYDSRLQELIQSSIMGGSISDESNVSISFLSKIGALVLPGQNVATGLEFDDPLVGARVHEILSDTIDAPLCNLLNFLNSSICIGPLRVIPDTSYQPNPYPKQSGWYSGESAWDVVQGESQAVDLVNSLLRNNEGLHLGCELRRKATTLNSSYMGNEDSVEDLVSALKSHKDIKITLSSESLDVNPDAEQMPVDVNSIREFLSKELSSRGRKFLPDSVEKSVVLWDISNKIEVSASELGVGVSQIFPFIIAKALQQNGLIACEQPELHVHPRVQVGIGDLLLDRNQNTSSLIETHSELLILRLLRRIRETSDGELPDGFEPVKPEGVSIVYLEPSDTGVKTRRINIDVDGEFVERWPQGFFVERSEELF